MSSRTDYALGHEGRGVKSLPLQHSRAVPTANRQGVCWKYRFPDFTLKWFGANRTGTVSRKQHVSYAPTSGSDGTGVSSPAAATEGLALALRANLWTDTENQAVSAKGRRRGTEEAGYPGSSQTRGTSFTKAQSHETFREQRIIWTLIHVQTVGPIFWWVSYMWKFSQKMNFKTKVFKHRSEWLHVYKMHVGILWVQFQTTATRRYCGFNSRPRS